MDTNTVLAYLTAVLALGGALFGGGANFRMGKVVGLAETWSALAARLSDHSDIHEEQGVALIRLDARQERSEAMHEQTDLRIRDLAAEVEDHHQELSGKMDGLGDQLKELARWTSDSGV